MKAFHPTAFVFDGGVSGIVFRHRRGHVAYDGLNDRKRNACYSSVVTERVTAGMQVLHADRAGSPFRDSRGLNPQSLQELLDPVGNAVRVCLVHLSVLREHIFGFCPLHQVKGPRRVFLPCQLHFHLGRRYVKIGHSFSAGRTRNQSGENQGGNEDG